MSFQKELQRYMNDLQEFDLEAFFHDETFLDMLEYRTTLADNIENLSSEEQKSLHFQMTHAPSDDTNDKYCNR